MLHFPSVYTTGLTEGEPLPAPAWEGREEAPTALVSRGTNVPLPN